MMTVSELIEHLQELPGDARVLLQKDSEGNGYKQTYGAEVAYSDDAEEYQPESAHSEEDLAEDYCDLNDYEKVVVIY
jgi:hypothetical protein